MSHLRESVRILWRFVPAQALASPRAGDRSRLPSGLSAQRWLRSRWLAIGATAVTLPWLNVRCALAAGCLMQLLDEKEKTLYLCAARECYEIQV
jgi:hypothetical protein